MGGWIAQLRRPADVTGGESHLMVLPDFARNKIFTVTYQSIRRYRVALETQDPEAGLIFPGSSGGVPTTVFGGDVDPASGSLLIQRTPTASFGLPNFSSIYKYDPTTLVVTGTFGASGTFGSWPTSLRSNTHFLCVQAGSNGYIVGLEANSTNVAYVVNATTMAATGFHQSIPIYEYGATVPLTMTKWARGLSGSSGGVVYFVGDHSPAGASVPADFATVSAIRITSGGIISSDTIGTITPTMIDLLWTGFRTTSLGYDQVDGNLLAVFGTDTTNRMKYFAKISTTDASIIWKTEITGDLASFLPAVPGYVAYSMSANTIGHMNGSAFGVMDASTGGFSSFSTDIAGITISTFPILTAEGMNTYSSIGTPDGAMFLYVGSYTRGGSSPVPVEGTPDSFTTSLAIVLPLPDDAPPVAPGASGCEPRTDTSLTATWTPTVGATGYTLEYHAVGDVTWIPVAVGDVLTYTLTGLTSGVDYVWRVTATVGGDPVGPSNSVTCAAPPPPIVARLAMDSVVATALDTRVSVNLISLRWSDDRGHSYGSPVSQPIGAIGEYRKSLIWQRLGMGRDRPFEIFWSVPMPTALQGAWIEVTPAQT